MKSKYLAAILLAAALLALGVLLLRPRQAVTAEIYRDGELYRTIDLLSLTEPMEIPVGDGNTVLAEQGRVRMLHADCPDQLCVRMGWTDSAAKPIVCLPNGVTVVVTGGSEERDAVLR